MKCPKTMKFALNGVQVALFGLKLCQNDATDLRIILGALLDPKNKLKKNKNPDKFAGPSASGVSDPRQLRLLSNYLA